MNCAVCKHGKLIDDKIDYQTKINGEYVLVKNVPAQVCNICGEQFLSYDTVKMIETHILIEKKPYTFVNMAVFDVAS